MTFTTADVKQLHGRGVSVEDAERQLELLREPTHHARLVRACTIDDGIVQLEESDIAELHAIHADAAKEGRLQKLVPASGAATRMFKSLLRYHNGPLGNSPWDDVVATAGAGDQDAAELVAFVEQLPKFACHEDLRQLLSSRGDDIDALAGAGRFAPILDALLGPAGLDYASRPKGLLKFHRYDDGGRTAFEEHLVEAGDYARDGNGMSRLHLTVSRGHRRAFEAVARSTTRRRADTRFDISYSEQKRSTDTLSLTGSDRPLRDDAGHLMLRPSGHGALIENLHDLQADLVFIKNIDNVQPDRTKPVTSYWKRALCGYLVQLQREVFRYLDALREPKPSESLIDQARVFARECMNLNVEGQTAPMSYQSVRALLISKLNRPLRVCGVVRNTGEPGGGPFWVKADNGTVSLQIVETSQVAPDDATQQQTLRSATHFNPVDLICGVRDFEGRPFDLKRFVDQRAVIVTAKSHVGRELRVLERPGLWNGAMAHWNTMFVEVPIATFTPVKTVCDLLRPEHQ